MTKSDSEKGGFEKASECFACGAMIAAVDEETHRKMLANHVLEEHSDQANSDLLEECREVLELDATR